MDDISVPLDRERLQAVPWNRIHRARSWAQATIWGLEWEGRPLIVKDFADRGWLRRATVGRWTIRKEARVYAALQGELGVPEVFGAIEGPALVMERLPRTRLPHRAESDLTPAFFDALDAALDAIHSRGVTHCDIRRKNIAIGEDGLPRLIDFTTAHVCRPGAGGISGAIHRHHTLVDRITALRIRRSFFPNDTLTEAQRDLLAREPWTLKVGRWMRHNLYRPFKKRVLRR
jgi:serine/threonine protein kinase